VKPNNLERPAAGQLASRARQKRAGRLEKTGWPADRPHHSVECAGPPAASSKSGSGGLFLPISFAGGVKDALFLPPRGPTQPLSPRHRPQPLKSTTYRVPTLTERDAPRWYPWAASVCSASCRAVTSQQWLPKRRLLQRTTSSAFNKPRSMPVHSRTSPIKRGWRQRLPCGA
jgi:hypothetical protein